MPSSREVDELGVIYAERGFALASVETEGALVDRDMALEFARIAAMALNDVGRNADAIERADFVLSRVKDDPEAAFERAVALFERCQFDDAKAAFQKLVTDKTRSAHAHYHLALLLEREGKQVEADKHFAKAQKFSPEQFWAPVILTMPEFEAELQKLIDALEPEVKRDLANVPIKAEDIPQLADLTTGEPPLSPTILGLFRGPPLQEQCIASDGDPCRSVALYRKNLGRAVKTREELIQQMRVTLLRKKSVTCAAKTTANWQREGSNEDGGRSGQPQGREVGAAGLPVGVAAGARVAPQRPSARRAGRRRRWAEERARAGVRGDEVSARLRHLHESSRQKRRSMTPSGSDASNSRWGAAAA